MQIIQAGTEFINQVRGKCVRVTESALLGYRGLSALLEATAVRYATENARNELRIVDETESEEQLVLFIEIDVHSSIEGVAMLEKMRRISEIGEKGANRIARRLRIQIQKGDCIGVQPIRGNYVQAASRHGIGTARWISPTSAKRIAHVHFRSNQPRGPRV